MTPQSWKIIVVAFGLVLSFWGQGMAFEIVSDGFENGGQIPRDYTCDGADRSPALKWANAPAESSSFVLVADDPDAPMGSWVHWLIYNIPADVNQLPEGVSPVQKAENGAAQGRNDFGRVGYGGPCPPPGKPHRYYFRLLALDTNLNLPPGLQRAELMERIKNHVLEETQLAGLYGRRR